MSRDGKHLIDETLPVGNWTADEHEEGSGISLLVYHRDGARMFPLEPGSRIVVGRDPEVDLPVRDRSLSRHHARLECVGDEVLIEDLGSTNGIWLGGERVTSRSLRIGDEVLLGNVVVSVQSVASMERKLYGLESHDRFVAILEEEVMRARAFGRGAAVVMIRPAVRGDGSLNRWCPAVRKLARPFDHMALYSPDMVEMLLPEATHEEALKFAMSARQAAKDDTELLCGVASLPTSATSADALREAALGAVRQASLQKPVASAASQVSQSWTPGEPQRAGPNPIVESPAMVRLYDTVRRVATSSLPVLIFGETGAGKELVARALHELSPRRERKMVSVNCGAIPDGLVESTLFGHEKGAFTGATERSDGVFQAADGGTVFLDEIGELPAAAQVALLRVIESGRFTRVGSTRERQVEVRVVAATHRDLEERCNSGDFRWDLYYRLNGMNLVVPPLRERHDEIGPMVRRFIDDANRTNGCSVAEVDEEALELVHRYPWPGNVRELKNAIERSVVIAQGGVVTVDDLPERVRELRAAPAAPAREEADEANLKSKIQSFEADLIRRALRKSGWDRNEAARRLGIPVRTLSHKIRTLGIERYESADE